jgi:hypothetical protein
MVSGIWDNHIGRYGSSGIERAKSVELTEHVDHKPGPWHGDLGAQRDDA